MYSQHHTNTKNLTHIGREPTSTIIFHTGAMTKQPGVVRNHFGLLTQETLGEGSPNVTCQFQILFTHGKNNVHGHI